jgi:hypothetical protein
MPEDHIRYDILAQEALRGVVRKVLAEVAKTGLPGEHHFFISFVTKAPGVRLSQRLREKHPDEMTIVLQHQFWDLSVGDHSFEVGLSFSGVPERLLVPFDAISTFFDPSVQFGLKFEAQGEPEDAAAMQEAEPAEAPPAPARIVPAALPATKGKAPAAEAAAAPAKAEPAVEGDDERGGAEVVSLDSFRKKP